MRSGNYARSLPPARNLPGIEIVRPIRDSNELLRRCAPCSSSTVCAPLLRERRPKFSARGRTENFLLARDAHSAHSLAIYYSREGTCPLSLELSPPLAERGNELSPSPRRSPLAGRSSTLPRNRRAIITRRFLTLPHLCVGRDTLPTPHPQGRRGRGVPPIPHTPHRRGRTRPLPGPRPHGALTRAMSGGRGLRPTPRTPSTYPPWSVPPPGPPAKGATILHKNGAHFASLRSTPFFATPRGFAPSRASRATPKELTPLRLSAQTSLRSALRRQTPLPGPVCSPLRSYAAQSSRLIENAARFRMRRRSSLRSPSVTKPRTNSLALAQRSCAKLAHPVRG